MVRARFDVARTSALRCRHHERAFSKVPATHLRFAIFSTSRPASRSSLADTVRAYPARCSSAPILYLGKHNGHSGDCGLVNMRAVRVADFTTRAAWMLLVQYGYRQMKNFVSSKRFTLRYHRAFHRKALIAKRNLLFNCRLGMTSSSRFICSVRVATLRLRWHRAEP